MGHKHESGNNGTMTDPAHRPLDGAAFYWLVAAMFSVTLGYGVLLPVLPFLLERLLHDPTEAAISYHTGWLMGTFMFALFVCAPLWGFVSDRIGRRAVIVVSIGRISDSCGYAVPFMDFVAERDVLERSHERQGAEGLVAYREDRNTASIDGLPGLAGVNGSAAQHAG